MPNPVPPPLKTRLLGPWRRRCQWATTLLLLGIPWLHLGGESLLRIDLPTLSLHILGQTLRIAELYLFLFFALAVGLGFLLVTMVFGRVWCGWACPQTTLSDVAEWLARRLGLQFRNNRLHGPAWRRLLLQVAYIALALLVAANLLWYFIEPRRFFADLVAGRFGFAVWATLTVVALTVYLDLALVRRLLCRDFCPYGRLQTTLADRATLTLHRPATEVPRCIECGACVRCCPMEIDIRRGFQVECINCGRCLDACRRVMAKRGQAGLIRYSFGTEGRGARALLNPRTLLLAGATLIMATILTVAVQGRPEASLQVARSRTAASKLLADGQQATFFNIWVGNRGKINSVYELQARDAADQTPLPLRGAPGGIALAPGANRRFDLVLLTAPVVERRIVEFVLLGSGRTLATARVRLDPEKER